MELDLDGSDAPAERSSADQEPDWKPKPRHEWYLKIAGFVLALVLAVFTITGVVVSVVEAVTGADPSSSASSSPTSTITVARDGPILAGDCLRHPGQVEPIGEGTLETRPAGDLDGLEVVPCDSAHELQVLSYPGDVAPAWCAPSAVIGNLGTWRWSNRFVGAPMTEHLCAIGLREGTRLQSVDYDFSTVDDPMMRFGACERSMFEQQFEVIASLYIACEPGYYLHMQVLASTAEVAKASCANFDKEIGSQGKYAINQVREEDSSHFLLDCVFRLNSNADSWSD